MVDRRSLLNDHIEAQTLMLDGRQSDIWTALPCMVTKVNLTAMTIECQPTIQGQISDQNNVLTYVNLPVLVDVPIVFPSCGAFTITFPIAIGDECLVIFASRCIDNWWNLGGVQQAFEGRLHDLSDGMAIFGPKSQPNVVPSISSTDLQIRNNSGSTFISVAADGSVKIKAPTTTITGDLIVTGEVKAGLTEVPLTTHTHGGVTTGSGDTGVPIP